mgnify:CR=1 FL=1
MRTLVMARFTFREAVRKRILYAALGLTVIFFLVYWAGCFFAFQEMRAERLSPTISRYAAAQILLAGLYVVNFMAGLLAIFTAAGTIAGEVEHGTLHAVVPKPLHRWELVLGKWLGFALMLSLYAVVSSAIAIAVVYTLSGYLPPYPVQGTALSILSVLLLLSLTILGSTALPTIAAGIVVFMLYALATVGGMIEQLGQLLQNTTMINIGIITSLVIPSDVIWKMASYLLQPPAPFGRLTGPAAGPFTVATPPSETMIAYSVLYTGAALGLAVLAFRRRDL